MNHIIIVCLNCESIVSEQIEVSSSRKPSEKDVQKIVDAYLEHEYSQPGFEGHLIYWQAVKELELIPMEVEA